MEPQQMVNVYLRFLLKVADPIAGGCPMALEPGVATPTFTVDFP